MAEHADYALQAAMKALAEVVAPAVDPQDPLAVDQLRLVVSWLQFDATRRHQERALARAELALRIALAEAVQPHLQSGPAQRADALDAALRQAHDAHRRTDARSAHWRNAAEHLDTLVSEAVSAATTGPAADRAALADVVLRHAYDSLLIRRAWFAPLGFEARPDAVPMFEALVADPASHETGTRPESPPL